MIPGSTYLPIYLILVIFSSIVVIQKYRSYHGLLLIDKKGYALFLAIVFSLFIGGRPVDAVFADTVGYATYFKYITPSTFFFLENPENIVFDNIIHFFATSGLGYELFFIFIAVIYFIGTYIACRKFFHNNTLAAYLVFLIAFSTFSYAVNGIKAGAASAIFLCAIAYKKDHPKISILLAVLSWTFHHSMFVCLAAYFVICFYSRPKWYFLFWVVCLLLSLAHVSYFQNIFVNISDEKGASYLDSNNLAGWGGEIGFRYDFVLYSMMPILIGWYAIYKKGIISRQYNEILCFYLLVNGLWLLCMYAGFTNRIAYLSWLIYPIVLIYPYLDDECAWGSKRYSQFSIVMLLHMMFTVITFFTGQYH